MLGRVNERNTVPSVYLIKGFDGTDEGVEIADPPVGVFSRLDLSSSPCSSPWITVKRGEKQEE